MDKEFYILSFRDYEDEYVQATSIFETLEDVEAFLDTAKRSFKMLGMRFEEDHPNGAERSILISLEKPPGSSVGTITVSKATLVKETH